MHDTAYGSTQPYPDRFAQVLLDRLLTGLAERGLRTAPLPVTVVPGER
jgi:nucleotide-binding universal stress UspA family protein